MKFLLQKMKAKILATQINALITKFCFVEAALGDLIYNTATMEREGPGMK
jgi:hypothetical protein